MGFEFHPNPRMVLGHSAEKGCLTSITDNTTPYHQSGTVYYDRENDKTYVYAYNAAGAAVAANVVYLLTPKYNTAGEHWQVVAVADDTVKKHKYACVPAAALPSTYYGWVQVQGTASISTSDTDTVTNQAWAVGDELYVTAAIIATQADTTLGVIDTTFGFAQVSHASDHTATTAVGTIYLIGREFQATS